MTSKAILKKEKSNVVPIGTIDYGEHGGDGLDDVGREDFAIPFISVLQDLSEVVKKNELKGARAGALYNNVTKSLYDAETGLPFLPAFRQKLFVQWRALGAGGGYVASHEPDSAFVHKLIAANGGSKFGGLKIGEEPARGQKDLRDDVVETHYVYGLILSEDGRESDGFAVIPFTSTKISKLKNWLSAMKLVRGRNPLYAFRTRIVSTLQSNAEGDFYNLEARPLVGENWGLTRLNPADEEEAALLEEARTFRNMVETGAAQADLSKQREERSVSSHTAEEATEEEAF